ncbi:MAG: hypothetical protein U9O59_02755 [Actinomycetota bacterium]|nr:hypothetical protein [Actinomycetota bacterium]
MRTINLLPKEEKVRDVKSIILNVVLVIMVVLMVVVGILTVVVYNINSELTPELEDHERVNLQLNNYVRKLDIYNDFKDKVKEKEKTVEYLQEVEITWSDALIDFGKKIPENMYITLIEVDGEEFYKFISQAREEGLGEEIEKVKYLTIDGYALGYTDITKMLVQINNMENTTEATINSIYKDYITDSNIEVLAFTISAYFDVGPYIEELGLEEGRTAPAKEEVLEEEIQAMD